MTEGHMRSSVCSRVSSAASTLSREPIGTTGAARLSIAGLRRRLPRAWFSRPFVWRRSWARDFFPSVDAGQITLHVRPPVGTRIEDASAMFGDIERTIRADDSAGELSPIVDNIGLPSAPSTRSITIPASSARRTATSM